jgi:hypothetical protein
MQTSKQGMYLLTVKIYIYHLKKSHLKSSLTGYGEWVLFNAKWTIFQQEHFYSHGMVFNKDHDL